MFGLGWWIEQAKVCYMASDKTGWFMVHTPLSKNVASMLMIYQLLHSGQWRQRERERDPKISYIQKSYKKYSKINVLHDMEDDII